MIYKPFPWIEVLLTKGMTTLMDEIDFRLTKLKWYAQGEGLCTYAWRRVGRPKRIAVQLHRVILSNAIGRALKADELTDHVNGDGLDNRRWNLRVASNAQNVCNQKLRKDNQTGVKGVYAVRDKFRAQIRHNGQLFHLGYFATLEEANSARIKAAQLYQGEFARAR